MVGSVDPELSGKWAEAQGLLSGAEIAWHPGKVSKGKRRGRFGLERLCSGRRRSRLGEGNIAEGQGDEQRGNEGAHAWQGLEGKGIGVGQPLHRTCQRRSNEEVISIAAGGCFLGDYKTAAETHEDWIANFNVASIGRCNPQCADGTVPSFEFGVCLLRALQAVGLHTFGGDVWMRRDAASASGSGARGRAERARHLSSWRGAGLPGGALRPALGGWRQTALRDGQRCPQRSRV